MSRAILTTRNTEDCLYTQLLESLEEICSNSNVRHVIELAGSVLEA
jgi:hypothetical protein